MSITVEHGAQPVQQDPAARQQSARGPVMVGRTDSGVVVAPVDTTPTTRRSVAFVGGGPGEPDLLTVRAAALVAAAEVLVVPETAAAERWAAVAGGARVVGIDSAGGPTERARLLADLAGGGAPVVRVVPGDVLSSAGMAEELTACRRLGLDIRIVPGVAPATAWTTYAGVPFSRADGAPVQVLDLRCSGADGSAPVAAALRAGATTVVLGDSGSVGAFGRTVSAQLTGDDVPALVTRHPGTVLQRSVGGRLGDMADHDAVLPELDGATPDEAVMILGPGAAAERLDWFESRPLFAWRVLVPRTREQSGALDAELRGYGAVPVEVPTISVEPPRTPQQMDRAIRGLVEGRYQWVAFTSANALRAVRGEVHRAGPGRAGHVRAAGGRCRPGDRRRGARVGDRAGPGARR